MAAVATDCRSKAFEAFQSATVLGEKQASRLVLLDYILRIGSLCDGLSSSERTKVTRNINVTRLVAFRRRLARCTSRATGQQLTAEKGTAPSPLEPSPSSKDAGALLDALIIVCKSCTSALLRDVQEAMAIPNELPLGPKADGGGTTENALARVLPAAFVESSNGKQALDAIAGLSAADLELILQDSRCAPEFTALLEPFATSSKEQHHEAATIIRHMAATLPRRGSARHVQRCESEAVRTGTKAAFLWWATQRVVAGPCRGSCRCAAGHARRSASAAVNY
jgi:hypothetical protein